MSDAAELNDLVFQAVTAVDRFVGNQNASQSYVRVRFATDDSVGEYPQAAIPDSEKYLEGNGEPYQQDCPVVKKQPVPLKLRRAARWTDVLSSDLWSEGWLVNEKAIGLLKGFPLGNHLEVPAVVQRRKETRSYSYVFIANHVSLEDVDFARSAFYVADMIGSPVGSIEVESAEDLAQKRRNVNAGAVEGFKRFSRVECQRLQFRKGRAPQAAVFGLGSVGIEMYLTRELCVALRRAGVTGLEFRRNNKLFNASD